MLQTMSPTKEDIVIFEGEYQPIQVDIIYPMP